MANVAQGAYMLVNDYVSGDCATQANGEALKRYDFSDSTLDFRDLGYYSVEGEDWNSFIQMHCHPDRGYQVLVWHGSHASDMRYGTIGVDGENTWDYTGFPRFTLSVNANNKASFLAGSCIAEGGYTEESWSESLSVTFYAEGATVYLPDCEDYDPGEFCPNCYKMSEFLGLGFDLTEDSSHLNQRQHVARLMGDEEAISGSTYVSIDNTDFREIDRVVQEGTTSSFEDSGSMQSARSLELGVEGSYGVADISSSVGLSDSQSSSFESSMARSETVLQQGLNTLEFKSSDAEYYPTFQFWKAAVGMNEYCADYPPNNGNSWCYDYFVDNIVEEFGTHYISKITMGGQVTFIQETSSCLEASARESAVESSLCVGVEEADIEGCATATQTESSTTEQSSLIESYMLEIVGGDNSVSLQVCTYSNDGFACDFAAFAETVNDDTAGIVTFELRETAALVGKIRNNLGRWQSTRGGWAGFEQVDLDDFFADYIKSKSMQNTGCCGGCAIAAASSHFSLVTLIAAVCFTAFN
jgi:hypothetical protein